MSVPESVTFNFRPKLNLLCNIKTDRQKNVSSNKIYPLNFVSSVSTATVFTLKNPEEEHMEAKSDEEEDDFQTDDDEEMEVDKQEQQKRKKVRGSCLKLPMIQMLMSGISYKNPTGFCNNTTTVIFMSSRSREVVFRRNFEITTGNRDARNVGKCEEKCKFIHILYFVIECRCTSSLK